MIMVDLVDCYAIETFLDVCENEGINATFYKEDDLICKMEDTELLFIDTWHVYGHLKRELARWHSHAKKYIILHDTTVDGEYGESIRMGWNMVEQSKSSGIPVHEIARGLWPAVEEFLRDHPEWSLKERFTNNNGLTVLARSV
jgi:cephalosporin hydroxylase